MKSFINEEFLLTTEAARRLYHGCAEDMPVIDYHCHLSPADIYADKRFADIGEAWLADDHYKWRVMRANAVPEEYVSGKASFREKFMRFAAVMPGLIGNPIYHWSHLELKRYFGFGELLDASTAQAAWDCANAKLQSPAGSARSLISAFNIRALCTTDDPADDLRWHKLLAADKSFETKVLPTFRPDKALGVDSPDFPAYAAKLAEAAGAPIRTADDMKAALEKRIEYFAAAGCRLSDHAFAAPDFTVWDEKAAEAAIRKALGGERPTPHEAAAYRSLMMDFLGEEYSRRGMAMQLHFGVVRSINTKLLREVGPDAGGDTISDTIPIASLAALLDRLAERDALPKTILYTLNASDYNKLAACAGCFYDASARGKMQFGAAWWFNDHIDGMTAQLKTLANIGVLSRFIGMLTDSRSFLSFPRHEYFRRILCELVGGWIEKGLAPADYDGIGEIIRDVCFNNVRDYIAFEE